jgi:hypothetical protein
VFTGWIRCRSIALAGVVLALLGACSEEDPVGPELAPFNNLVFTREDGSRIPFSNEASVFVWCGPWEQGILAESLQIIFGGPGPTDPRLQLRAVMEDLSIGEPQPLPNTFVFDDPDSVEIFVFDPPNEVSSQIVGTGLGGQITFQKLDCPDGLVEFTVDATLGSEFGGGPWIRVSGSFRATIEAAPSGR